MNYFVLPGVVTMRERPQLKTVDKIVKRMVDAAIPHVKLYMRNYKPYRGAKSLYTKDFGYRHVLSDLRFAPYVTTRQICMYFIYKHFKVSTSVIAHSFSGRDHCTVLHANKSVNNYMDTDKDFLELATAIELDFYYKEIIEDTILTNQEK